MHRRQRRQSGSCASASSTLRSVAAAMSSGGTHAGNATSTGLVGPGGCVLLVYRCKPLGREAVGDTNKCRPDPSVDERDSALDQASCNDILGGEKAVENGEDLMAGCVAPPASADWLAGDLLCKIRHRPASRLQYHPPLTHPSQRIHENRIQPRGRGPDYAMGGGPNGVRAPDELGCLIWPCSQNPGRKPAISRRA